MRKDVKLGLSVGSVLFAVIIVYLVVASHKNKNGVDIADIGDQAPVDAIDPVTPVKPDVIQLTPTPPVKVVPDPKPAVVPPAPESAPRWTRLLAGTDKVEAPALNKHEEHKPSELGSGTVITPPANKPAASDTGAADGGVSNSKVTEESHSAGQRNHVVQPGESYSSIARAAYGRASYHTLIQRANPNVNPNRLRPGITIILPDAPAAGAQAALTTTVIRSVREDGAASPTDPAHEYRVKSGDSLYAISCKLYGRADRVEQLYELNRDVIGSDKGRLKLDMVLRLPESPTMTAQR